MIKNRLSGAAAQRQGPAAGGCGVVSNGDSKSFDDSKHDSKEGKKCPSWHPDPDHRWPVQASLLARQRHVLREAGYVRGKSPDS